MSLNLDAYRKLEHVLVSTSGGGFRGFIDEQLEHFNYRRKVTLSVHQFIIAPMIVASTNFVSTLPQRFAMRFTNRVDLFYLPFRVEGVSLFAAWHSRAHADPALTWLRNQLVEVARK